MDGRDAKVWIGRWGAPELALTELCGTLRDVRVLDVILNGSEMADARWTCASGTWAGYGVSRASPNSQPFSLDACPFYREIEVVSHYGPRAQLGVVVWVSVTNPERVSVG